MFKGEKFYIAVDVETGTLHKIGDLDLCVDFYKAMMKSSSDLRVGDTRIPTEILSMTRALANSIKVYEVPNTGELYEKLRGTCDYFKSEEIQNLITTRRIKQIMEIIE